MDWSNDTDVVAIDGNDLPAISLVASGGVLRLGVLGHLVERHVIGVVDDDQVVQPLVRLPVELHFSRLP